MAIPLLILSGPVGVGKTSLGHAVGEWLERRDFAHSFIDLDALAHTYPRPAGDRFADRLALSNLRDVWKNCAAAGSRNLIVARVVESKRGVAQIQAAVPGSRPPVCQLRASEATLADARAHARGRLRPRMA